jgi:ATP-dependent DNA helicase RecG
MSAASPVAAAVGPAGEQPLTTLRGVGPTLAAALAQRGLERVQDLWFHLPLRYEDRTRITPIAGLQAGQHVQVEGTVEAVERGFRFRPQLRVALDDGSGATLLLRFIHFSRRQAEQFAPGQRLRCYGEVRHGAHGPEIVHPQYRRVDTGAVPALDEQLTPVYPAAEAIGPRRLAGVVARALDRLPADAELELIPAKLSAPLRLIPLRAALLEVHRPSVDADLDALRAGTHPAQRRLAFEELLAHHIGLRRLRQRVRAQSAPVLSGDGSLDAAFEHGLAFTLTAAQRRVSAEIARDLAAPVPMLRLVQGDVGSGKTVVAARAALVAVAAGYQVALMAPTELLAEQHLLNLRAWFEPLGLEVTWLAGKVQGRARQAALARVASGAAVVVGTHALMQEGVRFARLGLAIIDEQHRFGVHQRLALSEKGRGGGQVPHQLVLTATPIPRTLAMTACADLDVSVIDELPPGRSPVRTVAIVDRRRDEVIGRIREACTAGRQAYWVCTLIEENEQLAAQAAEAAYAELSAALPGLVVALVHGRLKAAEKQALMQAFKAGSIALLVATTVIEVGVDVPNASLMVIENAERLGLAQLHQLRGRVGRGSAVSSCVLLYRTPLSALARERLAVLRATSDGFRIAEKDLELRGPGEVLGTRQTGDMAFRVADLLRDSDLLPAVRHVADVLLAEHPDAADRLQARWVGGTARFAHA